MDPSPTGTSALPLELIATTAFGLEAVVRRELEALGYEARVVSPGRIHFRGDERAICRANLWLRAADRILIEHASYPAPDFDALFDTCRALDWRRWIPADGAFPVIGRSHKSQLTSVPACQRAVKRAVVDSLLQAHGVAELPETGPQFRIEVALLDDVASITIDTSGPSLHKRGYRQYATRAPLKETMAAALVILSFWKAERPLIDPFCGGGTIPIEAAMLGRKMAPGLQRTFASETWPGIPAATWRDARQEAEDLRLPPFEERVIGWDIDADAIKAARINAEHAGVADAIHFQQRSFEQLSSKRQYGCVISNPPYGERLSDFHELQPLYESIPAVLRRLPTWSHFLLTSYPKFEQLIQRKADRRRKLYNGRIECTYYQFHGPRAPRPAALLRDSEANPTSATNATNPTNENLSEARPTPSDQKPPDEAAKPVFGGLTEKAHQQAELFRTRLQKRARHLRRWPTRQGITCYRLYERDIPEIPLVVDRYEDCLHITEYERPHDRDLGQHADWLDLMAKTAGIALDVERKRVFLKRRHRQRGATQHERVAEQKFELHAQEGGLKFVVNLSDYVDTGLFLDHRVTRGLVRDEAAGTRFLNLFGYTGSFTVYAADGRAAQSTTVDWSRSYLDWSQRNLELNGLENAVHEFVRADAREFLRNHPPGEHYDLAVVDPPTFSNSKRTEEDWDVQSGHAELLNQLLALMTPAGTIFFSSNFRRFKLAEAEISAGQIREISNQTVPEDFRNRRIHRCWRIVK